MTPDPTLIEQPSIEAKVMSYDHAHEEAVSMGYPSLTEALEHLDELRTLQGSAALPSVQHLRAKIAAIFSDFRDDDFLGPKMAADRILELPELSVAMRATTPTAPVQDDDRFATAVPYWERPYGDAGDAVDFACGHCEPDEAVAFLEDWRSAPHGSLADAWPGYMRWLKVQQDGARASAIEARQRTDPEEGLDPKGESAVPNGETPNPGSTPETGLVEALKNATLALNYIYETTTDKHAGRKAFEAYDAAREALSNVLPDEVGPSA